MQNVRRTWELLAALALIGLSNSIAVAEPIRVRLFYAGEPLTYLSHPEFSLRTPQNWIASQITPNPDGTFTMERPVPGAYMIHVVIDENKSNPGDYPGDYNIFQDFTVTETEPAELLVHMSKLMHVTNPWDNDKGIEGMLTGPTTSQPILEIPWFAWKRQIVFAWEPVVEGAEYRCTVSRVEKSGSTQLIQLDTTDTSATIKLPPSNPEEVYHFNIFAKKNGQTVGTLFVHDAGAQGWALSFRVVKAPISLFAVIGGLIMLLIGVLTLMKLPRSTAFVLIGILILSAFSYFLYTTAKQPTPGTSGRSSASQQPKVDRALVDEFKKSVPLPEWWNSVEPELPIRTFTDLESVWKSGGTMDQNRGKRFYKSAYKAIEDHPEVPDLVPFGLYLMSSVAADGKTRVALQKFWLDKFFDYQQRTDNCAHCMAGDTTGTMVRDYAENLRTSDPAAGIAMIQKLLKERDKDISPYNWALTLQTLARNQWQQCDKAAAVASLTEGLRRFPAGWQADQLRRTLSEFISTEPTDCRHLITS